MKAKIKTVSIESEYLCGEGGRGTGPAPGIQLEPPPDEPPVPDPVGEPGRIWPPLLRLLPDTRILLVVRVAHRADVYRAGER